MSSTENGDDMADLQAIRRLVASAGEVASTTAMSIPGSRNANGTFRATLASGAKIRVDLTIIMGRPS